MEKKPVPDAPRRIELSTAEESAFRDAMVQELSETAAHAADAGGYSVRWKRPRHREPLERRFTTASEAERFAAALGDSPAGAVTEVAELRAGGEWQARSLPGR
jgi:hypothetical protein